MTAPFCTAEFDPRAEGKGPRAMQWLKWPTRAGQAIRAAACGGWLWVVCAVADLVAVRWTATRVRRDRVASAEIAAPGRVRLPNNNAYVHPHSTYNLPATRSSLQAALSLSFLYSLSTRSPPRAPGYCRAL